MCPGNIKCENFRTLDFSLWTRRLSFRDDWDNRYPFDLNAHMKITDGYNAKQRL